MSIVSEFIPQALIVISASGILFILGRKFPQSARDIEKERVSLLANPVQVPAVNSLTGTRKSITEKFSKFAEKLLRKVKVLALKSDAKLMELIKYLQKKREPNGQLSSGEIKAPIPVQSRQIRERETIMNRMASIKKRLTENKQIARITSLRKEKKEPANQNSSSAAPRSVNVEEGRRAMFEMRERVLIKKISLNPRNADAYVELGRLYKESENWGDAKASFEQALKINKGNVIAKKLLKETEEKMPT